MAEEEPTKSSFEYLWELLSHHGGVAEYYKITLEQLWSEYTLEEQRTIYQSIREKLLSKKFVHYNPVKAVLENAGMTKRAAETLSYSEYYKRFGTTDEQEGWERKHLPEKQTTIYIKSKH